MEDIKYNLRSTAVAYDVGFEGNVVYCEMIRRLKQCEVSQVVKVIQKPTAMSAGEEISIRIIYLENGKEKKFPWIQASIADAQTKKFIDDLKSRVNSQVIWEEKTAGSKLNEEGLNVYDLQFLPLGYSGAGLSRGLQIWIYTICFGLLIFPLLYFIPLLVKGGYRVYTSDQGMEIRKFGSKKFLWDEITNVSRTQVSVKDRENRSTTNVFKIEFAASGKRAKVIMRYDHAVPLLKEMVEKQVLNEDAIAEFL